MIVLVGCGAGGASNEAQGDSDDLPVVSPLLLEQLDDLEADVMELRELEMTQSIERLFPSREDAVETILAMTQEELTDEVLFEETQFYLAFDFIDEGVDLWEVYAALLADQVAGFYDPDTEEMTVLLLTGGELGDSLPALERITYSHEYVHALQDQHFDLDAYTEDLYEPDATLAAMSLVEGDATLAMQDYTMVMLQKEPELSFQILADILAIGIEIPEGTPAILEAELTMPYVDGMAFVMALRNQGGWDAVDAAYANPPASTEQILHPEKYRSGDLPVRVEIIEVDPVLGDGWAMLYERTLGEFYLREYLDTQLSSSKAGRAAAGWGGDRYQLYYNEADNQRAWVLRLVWDTADDAAEFGEYYQEFAQSRIAGEVLMDDDTMRCWQIEIDVEALCLLQGDDVMIAYAPNWELAVEMIAAQQ
jgi:hypothetical protein